ncbi:MAG: ankyrin repeat domain-containing protein [Ardenticatenaceae bacterium]|nr:ankyrin repeat domain-containing protein [Anaerolineales bacterium]MCB8941915.1 ankyrin repeat domain-containing protein [Ardenticatenaceae bacterium]MCB8973029.1 ankyrin repeat domain-containing protein [Ardenticatenaceae bacterium]
MSQTELYDAVRALGQASCAFSDVDVSQPFFWRKHGEGVRLALIGTHHELQDLAATLAAQRSQSGSPHTLVQQVLGQYHTAYRELQATFLGITEEQFKQEPAAGEWPLRVILGHIMDAERAFFSLIISGLEQEQAGAERPFTFPDGAVERINGSEDEFYDLIDNQPLANILTHYDQFHQRVLSELAHLTDGQILGPSPVWWEEEEYSRQYRLHRFEAHMRQHHLQIEKVLPLLSRPTTEAHNLLRLVYRGLAAVENCLIGAPDLDAEPLVSLAQTISERTTDVQQIVANCRKLETAVNQNDLSTVQQIINDHPALADALGQNGLPLLMNAIYQRKTAVVEAIQSVITELDVFAAAALGHLERLQTLAKAWPGYLNQFAKDGFTPLQLACYFNQEAAALWLIQQGADVNAIAKNQMKIAPIHATATHGNLAILRALLENGAEVNAAQEGGFTAVHQAAHLNNIPMAQLLLEFGADPHQPDAKGQTALQLAQAEGHAAVTAVLDA